jgi:hypothetical protein
MAATRAGVVGMRVRHDGTIHWQPWVDVEVPERAVETGFGRLE